MRKKLLILSAFLCCNTLFAEEQTPPENTSPEKSPWELSATTSFAYYLKSDQEQGSSHFTGVSGPYDGIEGAVELDAAYTLPFLRGSSGLTQNNHATFNFGIEFTPITIVPTVSVTVSPIAFLEFAAGGMFGTGWNIGDIFTGMAKFEESEPGYGDMTPFSHWYLYGWASGCFMFDLAAIWAGDWHHIVTSATYKVGYQKLTGTEADVWLWRASSGQASGWIYEQKYILGYQMPLALSMIAVGTTLSGHYQSSDFGDYSSSYKGDYMTIDIWPTAEITFSKKDKMYVLFDFRARRSFEEKYKDDDHEPLMTYSGREWVFYRICLQWKHIF